MLAELHYKSMKCKNYIYMQYLAGGGCKFMILHKASFSLQQRNKLIYYSQVEPIFEKVPPTQIPIKQVSSWNPIQLIKELWDQQ